MYYPLRFHPVYKKYLWGGRSLAGLGKVLPQDSQIGESWEISAHPHGVSVIANGPLAGISLPEACRKLGQNLLGTALPDKDMQRFPLLIKFIDAHDRLSVQVHPDDLQAARLEHGEIGKTEMWYVVSARPDAHLIAGVKPGINRQSFARAINDGSCLDLLQDIPVKTGDVLNIPAGTVHAIGAGMVIYEIQQNADTTYRIFDYNRKDEKGQTRPLHIEQALQVIDFQHREKPALIKGIYLKEQGMTRRILVLNQYFLTEELTINGKADIHANGSRFTTLTLIDGKGSLSFSSSAGLHVSVPLFTGDSLLLPACLHHWVLSGDMKLIRCRPSLFRQDAALLAMRLNGSDQVASGTCQEKNHQEYGGPVTESLLHAEKTGLVSLEPYIERMTNKSESIPSDF